MIDQIIYENERRNDERKRKSADELCAPERVVNNSAENPTPPLHITLMLHRDLIQSFKVFSHKQKNQRCKTDEFSGLKGIRAPIA